MIILKENNSGNLWLGTGWDIFKSGGGINWFYRQSETFSVFKHRPEAPQVLESNIINDVMIDHKNQLWIGTSDK